MFIQMNNKGCEMIAHLLPICWYKNEQNYILWKTMTDPICVFRTMATSKYFGTKQFSGRKKRESTWHTPFIYRAIVSKMYFTINKLIIIVNENFSKWGFMPSRTCIGVNCTPYLVHGWKMHIFSLHFVVLSIDFIKENFTFHEIAAVTVRCAYKLWVFNVHTNKLLS